MRKLIARTALCGVMMISSGNSPLPETNYMERGGVAYITDLSIANTNQWVDSLLSQMYPPAVWPVDDSPLPEAGPPKNKPSLLKKPSPT